MLNTLKNIIKEVGLIVKQKRLENISIETKSDGSFVTNIDKLAETLILSKIKEAFGENELIISEELCASGEKVEVGDNPFWLVDPIDSTKSYIDNKEDYCINITYLKNNYPVIGLIYAPATDSLWYAEKGKGAFKEVGGVTAPIHVRKIPEDPTAVVSFPKHQLTEELINKYNIKHELVVASAIKFCFIAEGLADYYFRKKNHAADWDIASGHIIVEEAGGEVLVEDSSYKYGFYPYLAPTLVAKGK